MIGLWWRDFLCTRARGVHVCMTFAVLLRCVKTEKEWTALVFSAAKMPMIHEK